MDPLNMYILYNIYDKNRGKIKENKTNFAYAENVSEILFSTSRNITNPQIKFNLLQNVLNNVFERKFFKIFMRNF